MRNVFSVLIQLAFAFSVSCSTPVDPDNNETPNQDETPGGGDTGLQSTGRIMLPPGSGLNLNNLRVANWLDDDQSIAQSGEFVIVADGAGPVMSLLLDDDGDPVLLAYIDASPNAPVEISANECAAAMLFISLGSFTLPREIHGQVLDVIRRSGEVAGVAALIENRLEDDPKWLTRQDPELSNMLRGILSSASPPAGRSASKTSQRRLQTLPEAIGALVEPRARQSGVEVQQSVDNQGVAVVNWFRRYVSYFAYKTGFENAQGQRVDVDPLAQPLSHLDGSPVNGNLLESTQSLDGVIGTSIAVAAGDVAFSPRTSATIRTPLAEDERKAFYEVIVTGAAITPSSLVDLPEWAIDGSHPDQAEWERKVEEMTLLTFGKDVLIPMVFSIVLPAAKLADGEVDAADIRAFMLQLVEEIPELAIKIANGEWSDAGWEVIKALADNPGVRETFLLFLTKVFGEGFSTSKMFEFLNSANNVLTAFDIILAGTDIGFVITDVQNSRPYERFDVTVIKAPVRLQPEEGQVKPGESVEFFVSSTAEGAKTYVYKISNSISRVEDGMRPPERAELETDSNTVRFVADQDAPYGASVILKAEVYVDPPGRGGRVYVGEDASVITILDSVRIAPMAAGVRGGESVTFAADTNPLQMYTYVWKTSGNFGRIEALSGESSRDKIRTLDGAITYVADSGIAMGNQDTVTVEAFQDELIPIGSATATVHGQEQNQIMFQGTWDVLTEPSSPGRSCTGMYMFVPKIANAVSYALRAHGFEDTAFNPPRTVITVTWSQADNRSVFDEGGSWRLPDAGVCGPNSSVAENTAYLQGRFAGMIVDVTVTLSD